MEAPVQKPTTALMEAVQHLDREAGENHSPLNSFPIWQALEALPPDGPEGAASLVRAGEVFLKHREFKQASGLLQEVLRRTRRHHLVTHQALALALLSEMDRSLGLNRDAFLRLCEALSLLPEIEDLNIQARILLLSGLNDKDLGELKMAFQNLSDAYQVFLRTGQLDEQRFVLTHLGSLSTSMGEYPQAERLLLESLALAQISTDSAGKAWTLSNLGEVQRLQGRYGDAYRSLEESRYLFEGTGLELETMETENDLGHVAGAAHLLPQALDHYRRAYSVAARLDLSAQMVDTLAGLVVVLVDLDEITRALETAGYLLRHPSFTSEIELFFRPVLLPLLAGVGLPFTAGVEDPPIPLIIDDLLDFLENRLPEA